MDSDVIVIGAGVVGLAIAHKVAQQGHSTLVLEREAKCGLGISSRSSEVIHAGIYYQTKSLKASLCRRGKALLYEHCSKYDVPFRRTGKLFVAVSSEDIPRLESTHAQALSNGIEDVVDLNERQLHELEPELTGSAALLSPSSGIIDSQSYMSSLLGLAKRDGATFSSRSPVEGAEPTRDGWRVYVGGNEPTSVTARVVINAAGLYAIALSEKVFPGGGVPAFYPTKGCYLRYSGKSPLRHVVYPAIVPGQIEERVDATPDLGESLRFGPNVETARSLEDFTVSSDLVERLAPAIKRYLPSLETSRLHLDTAGIRPRIYGPDDAPADFWFNWRGEVSWLDLWGMESPALTASLAIGEHVWSLIRTEGGLG